MIDVIYSTDGKAFVIASSLRSLLEIKTPLSIWFPRMIDYGFVEGQDYLRLNNSVKSANGIKKEVFDWYVTVDMAKHIAMIQRTPKGKAIREYLLSIEHRLSEGEFLNQAQFIALFDICKVMGFFSVQKFFELEHYDAFLKKNGVGWAEERANLFGYTAADLKQAMIEVGKKYHNQRQAVFNLDRNDLIRTGVIELFIAMGKSKSYAKNVGNIAKSIAEQLNPEIYNDLDTFIDFKSPQQQTIITDIKKYKTDSKVLKDFLKGRQSPQITEDYNQKKLFDTPSGDDKFDSAINKALKKGRPPK